jgi:hypothetical protein
VGADACRLPFPDNTFDAAVSLDTIEHLPRTARPVFIEELKRVVKGSVVITCPLESADGLFQARKHDLRLSDVIAKRNGVQPGWLQEHLEQGHPTREELLELLPGAQVTGSDNCEAWLRFAVLQQRLFMWLFSGLFFLVFLRKQNADAPYRQGLIVWQKQRLVRGEALPASDKFVTAEPVAGELKPPESRVTSAQ